MPQRTGSGSNSPMRSEAPDRFVPAWHAWLEALATDAEAALGAALAYQALDDQGREAFLEALEQDAPRLKVPRVALYAPLLSVEQDEGRRERIHVAMGADFGTSQRLRPLALRGVSPSGDRIVVLVAPAYLDFVKVVSCRFEPTLGFRWVRTEPLVHIDKAPQAGCSLDGVVLEQVPVMFVVDEVAEGVVAQRRKDKVLPSYLKPLLDLFDARFRADDDGDVFPGL